MDPEMEPGMDPKLDQKWNQNWNKADLKDIVNKTGKLVLFLSILAKKVKVDDIYPERLKEEESIAPDPKNMGK